MSAEEIGSSTAEKNSCQGLTDEKYEKCLKMPALAVNYEKNMKKFHIYHLQDRRKLLYLYC